MACRVGETQRLRSSGRSSKPLCPRKAFPLTPKGLAQAGAGHGELCLLPVESSLRGPAIHPFQSDQTHLPASTSPSPVGAGVKLTS